MDRGQGPNDGPGADHFFGSRVFFWFEGEPKGLRNEPPNGPKRGAKTVPEREPANRENALFTIVFALGAALAGVGGVLSGPILSVYPGLDAEMLPLALIIVILGGAGSLPGAFLGSFVIGFIYNFGQVFFPDLAYVVLFLPMLLMLVLRPQGLFGKDPL